MTSLQVAKYSEYSHLKGELKWNKDKHNLENKTKQQKKEKETKKKPVKTTCLLELDTSSQNLNSKITKIQIPIC